MLKVVFQIALIFFIGFIACDSINKNPDLQDDISNNSSFEGSEYAPEFVKTAENYQNYQQLKLLFDSLYYYTSKEYHEEVFRTQVKLANLLRQTGNYAYGIKLLKSNLETKQTALPPILKGQTFNGLAAIYFEMYMHHQEHVSYLDSCWHFAKKTLAIARPSTNYQLEVDALTHLGAVFLHKGNYLEATNLLTEAYQLSTKRLPNPPLAIMTNLAWSALQTKDFESAMHWNNQCLEDAKEAGNSVFIGISLNVMAEIYDAQWMHEKAQKAFDQLKKYQAQDDIFFQSLMMKELVVQQEMKNYKQTMLGLYKEKYFLIRLSFIFIFIIIVLVLVSMGVYKLMRQQKHIREKEHELALARQHEDTLKIKNAELELTAKEAEQKTLEAKLESQDQELVYQSLKQIYFIQLTATIKEKFVPFQRKLSRKKDQEQFEKTLDEVCREASQNPLADFEQIFLQMHHGFYEKLLEISPHLSRSELQLCALLRMNLPSKEIASLLFLSLSTIDQKRHQIRKKLGLESNQSLNNFLINL